MACLRCRRLLWGENAEGEGSGVGMRSRDDVTEIGRDTAAPSRLMAPGRTRLFCIELKLTLRLSTTGNPIPQSHKPHCKHSSATFGLSLSHETAQMRTFPSMYKLASPVYRTNPK